MKEKSPKPSEMGTRVGSLFKPGDLSSSVSEDELTTKLRRGGKPDVDPRLQFPR